MAQQSKGQKKTMHRVMHEYKKGNLKGSQGNKVKTRKQAIAMALHEAGASNQESPQENARNYRRTKRREQAGKTGTRTVSANQKKASKNSSNSSRKMNKAQTIRRSKSTKGTRSSPHKVASSNKMGHKAKSRAGASMRGQTAHRTQKTGARQNGSHHAAR
ncbi:MAG: DUF6496 domain-containing protein [Alphaproteobacteria bacterium]